MSYDKCSVQFSINFCRVFARAEEFPQPAAAGLLHSAKLFRGEWRMRGFMPLERLLGTIFHKSLQSFCPSGRVSTACGNWAIAFCHTFPRRVAAVDCHAIRRVLGAKRSASSSLPRSRVPPPCRAACRPTRSIHPRRVKGEGRASEETAGKASTRNHPQRGAKMAPRTNAPRQR